MIFHYSRGGVIEAEHKKKAPKKKPVKTFNEWFALLDEGIKASDSLNNLDYVDKAPGSVTVASTPMAVAPAASAPVVDTTTTFMPAVAFPVGSDAAVLPASAGGSAVEPDLDNNLCFPVAMAASQILYSNTDPNLATEDYDNVLVFTADDEVGV